MDNGDPDVKLRMECLQLAGLYGNTVDGNIDTANKFFDFVTNRGSAQAAGEAPMVAVPSDPALAQPASSFRGKVTPINKRQRR